MTFIAIIDVRFSSAYRATSWLRRSPSLRNMLRTPCQLKNNPIGFLRRSTGDATDQLIQAFGRRVIGRVSIAPFLVR